MVMNRTLRSRFPQHGSAGGIEGPGKGCNGISRIIFYGRIYEIKDNVGEFKFGDGGEF